VAGALGVAGGVSPEIGQGVATSLGPGDILIEDTVLPDAAHQGLGS
jgi:hypothetical protein